VSIDPSSLSIRQFPDPVLRRRARPVDEINDEVRAVAERMIELMRAAPGVGLAAPQVGLGWRLFVAEVPPDEEGDDPDRDLSSDPPSATEGPQVYINPLLSDFERDLIPMTEGCLSLPDIEGEVRRPSRVTIEAANLDGTRIRRRAGGLLARVWQHEFDHLEGVLILDKMAPADRRKNKTRVKHLQAEAS